MKTKEMTDDEIEQKIAETAAKLLWTNKREKHHKELLESVYVISSCD